MSSTGVVDSMAAQLRDRAERVEATAEAHKAALGPIDMSHLIRLQQTALDYYAAAREIEVSRRDNVTLTFDRDGTKCREVFERGDDRVYRVEEELTPEGWRTIGVEAVENLHVR